MESGSGRHHDINKIFVVRWRKVIQLLMHTLDVHLLALLYERSERGAQVLHDQTGVVPGQVLGGFYRDVVQDERTDDRIDRTDTKLMEVLGSCVINVSKKKWIKNLW